MRDPKNIQDVAALNPDYMGLIFYPDSPRYVGEPPEKVMAAKTAMEKVGVFVNASTEEVLESAQTWGCSLVQLHGDESVGQCLEIRRMGYKVIKAFPIGSDFDFKVLGPYAQAVDFFLFDTKATERGGTGETFDWAILDGYELKVPFFISGGIGLEQLDDLDKIQSPQLYGLDVNSRFEISPGLKDVSSITRLVQYLDGHHDEI